METFHSNTNIYELQFSDMPQYVAYQKNVVYAFIKLSAKSHIFNILRTMDGLSCPTIMTLRYLLIWHYDMLHII